MKHRRAERATDWIGERRPVVEAVAAEAADVLGVAMSDVPLHGHRSGDRKSLVVEWC